MMGWEQCIGSYLVVPLFFKLFWSKFWGMLMVFISVLGEEDRGRGDD